MFIQNGKNVYNKTVNRLNMVVKMRNITMVQAKHEHEIGFLTRCAFEREAMAGGWLVLLGEGNGRGWLVDARSKMPRIFKTLDAAVRAVEEVGFEVNQLTR